MSAKPYNLRNPYDSTPFFRGWGSWLWTCYRCLVDLPLSAPSCPRCGTVRPERGEGDR